MAYQYDPETGDIVINGWENGIAPSPHKGIGNMQAVNIDTETGEVMANFARVQQSQTNSTATGTLTPNDTSHLNISFAAVLHAGVWINISASTITGLSTGDYYVVSSATGFTVAQLAASYDGAVVTGLGATGSATFTLKRNMGLPVASAIERYSDGTAFQFRYYILAQDKATPSDALVWVYDTGTADASKGLSWFLPDASLSTPAPQSSGIAVLGGWLLLFAGNTIWAKSTVNLTTGGWTSVSIMMSPQTSPNPHFAFVGHQGRCYYTDGNFIGSIFPNSSLLSGGPNIQSFAKWHAPTSADNTLATVTTLITGSLPTTGTSSILIPAVFFPAGFNGANPGTNPTALTQGTIYYIKYSLGIGTGTFQVFASSSTQKVISATINQAGANYSVNDVLTITGGGANATVTVKGVNSSGAITSLSISAAGTGYTTANNVSVTGGNGTGATVDFISGTGTALDLVTGATGVQYFNTFYPASAGGLATVILTPQHLNLPEFEISQSIAEIGNTLIIGTKSNYLYPWNQVDPLPGDLIPLPENDATFMLTVNNMAYVFAGNKGNIYLTNGASASRVLTAPDYCAGIAGTPASYVEPYFTWGGAAYIRGRVYFSILDQTSTKAGNCGGIWSFVPTQNLFYGQDTGVALRQENRSSYGTYSGYSPVIIPSQTQNALGTQYWNAWESSISSSTFGIDFTDTTPSTPAIIETDLIPTGTMLRKDTKGQIEFKLAAPADETSSVSVKYRLNLTDAFTTCGTVIEEGANPISGYFVAPFQNTQWLQLQVTLQPDTSTSSSFIRLGEIRIR